MGSPSTSREALGMRVPPARVVAGASRMRERLQRTHRRMAPPFMNVLESLMGLVDTKALFCAIDLNLPDLIGDRARTARELASETGADPDAIMRLLRYLVSRGFFRSSENERFSNNAATGILRSDAPFSARRWVEFFGSAWNGEIWNHLPERIRGKTSAAEAAFGVPFFEYLNGMNPGAGEAFNGAMAIGSRIQATLFGARVNLEGVNTLCDVGGGSGAVAAHLVQIHPGIHATVLDLAALEGEALRTIREAGAESRCRFIAGDFFESVPGGHDLYTLFAIVHDWDDAAAGRILSNIREVMAPSGRVMVVEKPVPLDDRSDFVKASDLLMLAFSDGGRERTDAEYQTLFRVAGFTIKRKTLLPSLYMVYELHAQ